MKIFIIILHIIATVSLMGLILLQSSKGGLGSAFGGGGAYRSKRGAEKIVFAATIAASVLFLITSILNLLVV